MTNTSRILSLRFNGHFPGEPGSANSSSVFLPPLIREFGTSKCSFWNKWHRFLQCPPCRPPDRVKNSKELKAVSHQPAKIIHRAHPHLIHHRTLDYRTLDYWTPDHRTPDYQTPEGRGIAPFMPVVGSLTPVLLNASCSDIFHPMTVKSDR